MTKLEPAYMPAPEHRKGVDDMLKLLDQPSNRKQILQALRLADSATREEVAARLMQYLTEAEKGVTHWRNDVYQVAVYANDAPATPGWPHMTHLSIKRNDRQPIHDWRDLQEIKNQLCGYECEAVELYPAESRRVDSANQYHLWVFDSPTKFPFGFNTRFVVDHIEGTLAQQRPLNDGLPWCEECRSYHVTPTTQQHHADLMCRKPWKNR